MSSSAQRTTVPAAFAANLERTPDRLALHIIEPSGEEHRLSYAELYESACAVAAGLAHRGVEGGDRLILALPTSRDFYALYLACLFTGVIPTVVPPLDPRGGVDGMPGALVRRLQARGVVVPAEDAAQLAGTGPFLSVGELTYAGRPPRLPLHAEPHAIAHLQATAGSTGRQKLARVSHGNIAANVQAIGRVIRARADDLAVIWLPLYHDMGLISFHCVLFWQCPLVTVDPSRFVRNPIKGWLDLISRHRATLSAAPNSAFQICARLAGRRRFKGLDLASWRVAFWGAEPVNAETVAAFCHAFEPYGLRRQTLLPVYGLAESTLASSIPGVEDEPEVDHIDAAALEKEGRARSPGDAPSRSVALVSLGPALPGHSLRIVTASGEALPERTVGEIELAGPSVVDGYWIGSDGVDGDGAGGPVDGSLKRSDGFLRTGDLGYLADGNLYVTGRKKDIIIHYGRNLVPSQVEHSVEAAFRGTTVRRVAACGVTDAGAGTELLHLLVECSPLPADGDAAGLEEAVRELLARELGLTGAFVHLLPKGSIPRTTSGKVQRYRCRELIQARNATGTADAGATGPSTSEGPSP